MKKLFIPLAILVPTVIGYYGFGQSIGVSEDNSNVDASAILDVKIPKPKEDYYG